MKGFSQIMLRIHHQHQSQSFSSFAWLFHPCSPILCSYPPSLSHLRRGRGHSAVGRRSSRIRVQPPSAPAETSSLLAFHASRVLPPPSACRALLLRGDPSSIGPPEAARVRMSPLFWGLLHHAVPMAALVMERCFVEEKGKNNLELL